MLNLSLNPVKKTQKYTIKNCDIYKNIKKVSNPSHEIHMNPSFLIESRWDISFDPQYKNILTDRRVAGQLRKKRIILFICT